MASFSENREDLKKELKRHCDEVCVDLEGTNEKQKERVERYENLGDEQFPEEGCGNLCAIGAPCKSSCVRQRSRRPGRRGGE